MPVTTDPGTWAADVARAWAAGLYHGDSTLSGTQRYTYKRPTMLRSALAKAGVPYTVNGDKTTVAASAVAVPSSWTEATAGGFIGGVLAVEGWPDRVGDGDSIWRPPVVAALNALGLTADIDGNAVKVDGAAFTAKVRLIPVIDWDRYPGTIPTVSDPWAPEPPDPEGPTVEERLAALELRVAAVEDAIRTPTPVMKPQPVGLVDRNGRLDLAIQYGLAGVIVEACPSELWPVDGPLNQAAVDALVAELDDVHAAGKWAILRFKGKHSNGVWVKHRDPTWWPFEVFANGTDLRYPATFRVCRYWTAEVQALYARFHTMLAAELDDHPALAGVCTWLGGHLHSEVLIRWEENRTQLLTLVSPSQDVAAVKAGVSAVQAAWQHTPTVAALNPYALASGAGENVEVAKQVGALADIRQNHGLGRSITGSRLALYEWMAGAPCGYQTQTLDRLDSQVPAVSLAECVDIARQYGAMHVELPTGWHERLTAADVASLQAQLS